MAGGCSSPSRWRCTAPLTSASRLTGSLLGTAAGSLRGEASCSPPLSSTPEPPGLLQLTRHQPTAVTAPQACLEQRSGGRRAGWHQSALVPPDQGRTEVEPGLARLPDPQLPAAKPRAGGRRWLPDIQPPTPDAPAGVAGHPQA